MSIHAERPNVLILMSDQHSKHVLGCYGNEIVRTPNLDRFAAEGTRFTNAYCPSPLCVPSRMAFLTARTPTENRCWKNSHILHSATPTWAHAMGAAGYETALIGRMHFVGPDQRHGFMRRPLGEHCAFHPGVGYKGAPFLGPQLKGTSGQTRKAVVNAGWGSTTYQAFDEMVTEATCAFLREKGTDDSGQPFAAVSGFLLPHCPYVAPKELFDYYFDRVDVPVQSEEELAREPAAVTKFKLFRGLQEPLSEHQIRVARAAYFGLVEYYDSFVGKILDALEEAGLAENTLVIYTSDHGEMAGEHGCWWKSNYYEGSVSVPLIARLPSVIPAGETQETICNLMDLGPTMLEMIQEPPMPKVTGRSIWPHMRRASDAPQRQETYSEHMGGRDTTVSRMVRRGPWKLYHYHDDLPPVLYNLDDDPDEEHDLALDPLHEAVVDDLMGRLYDGWDPLAILRESARLDHDLKLLERWGEATQLIHEDQVIVSDVEDVTLI
jgi:choline-sulfatase